MHDISMIAVEDHEGKVQEALQACVREFDMLEKKFAVESERLG